MDKLVRKIEIPLARKIIEKAGLYIVQKKDLDRLAEVGVNDNIMEVFDITGFLDILTIE